MIQNIEMDTLTPLCKKTEMNCWENRPFTTIWSEKKKKVMDITRTIKKKPKRIRTAFTTDQLRVLEVAFANHKYINSERRKELAGTLSIGEKCIKIWFQNRRMKEKKESSESSGESSGDSFADTPSISGSPPLPKPQNEHENAFVPQNPINHYNQFANNDNFCHYQLPTYNYNSNDIPQNLYEGMPMTNFYYDNNVYPTQYYPNENGYFINGINSNYDYVQYGNRVNSTWTPNNAFY